MLQTDLPEKQIQGNPLELHLRAFAKSLLESGYRKRTIQEKLYLLTALGWWFGRRERSIADIDEDLVEAFAKHKRRTRRPDLTTLQQFVDHLRKSNVSAKHYSRGSRITALRTSSRGAASDRHGYWTNPLV